MTNRSHRMIFFLVITLNIILGGKSVLAQQEEVEDAYQMFHLFEQSIIDLKNFRIHYHITSEGAYRADIQGILSILDGTKINLTGEGTLGRERVRLSLSSDGQLARGGSQRRTFEAESPEYLAEAIIFGFTRRGLLHTLMQINEGELPEASDIDPREWFEIQNLIVGPRTIDDVREYFPYVFDSVVDGTKIAHGRLWINMYNQLPFRRELEAYFPAGTAGVVEVYAIAQ